MLKYASMFKYYFIIDVTPFYIIIHCIFFIYFFVGGGGIKHQSWTRLNIQSGFFKNLSSMYILLFYLHHLQANVSHAENKNQKFWYPFLNYWSNIVVWSILIIALSIMAPDFKVNINIKYFLIQYLYIYTSDHYDDF